MSGASRAYRLANWLYEHCYPLYLPTYAAWKAFTDRRERALLRRIVRPGMVIADVGANIGVYTRFLADLLRGTGEVHAFEPSDVNFRKLEANLRRYSNVKLNHAAVAAHDGQLKLFISADLNVDHQTFDAGDGRASVDVRAVTLDRFFAGRKVDLVKMDVQGFEFAALRGMAGVLQRNPDIAILMEFWPFGLRRAQSDPGLLLSYLEQLGFSVVPVGRKSTAQPWTELVGEDEYVNLIVARPHRLSEWNL